MAARSLFDTRVIAASQRFGAWRESIGVIFDVNPGQTYAPEEFDARVESLMFDGLVMNRCQSRAQSFDRPVSRFAADGLDHYMIQLLLRGGVTMSRGRRTLRAPTGAIIGFDLADVLDSANDDFDVLSLFIPRRRLAPLLTHPDSLHGNMIDTRTGAGRLLADYLKSVYQTAPQMEEAECAVTAEVLLRLISMAFNAADIEQSDPPDWADQTILVNARAVMRDRLHDPDLGVEAIAKLLGVSRARLYRAFSDTGGVMETLREKRLRRCFTDLVSPSQAHYQIAEIAYRSGFPDPASFARAFRARFGLSPREARMSSHARRSLNADSGALDRSYETWIASIG